MMRVKAHLKLVGVDEELAMASAGPDDRSAGASAGASLGQAGQMLHEHRELAGCNLSLLGGFTFSVEGDAILGISTGSQRLLAFLALREKAATRHEVAGTLWPESTDQHAGSSLRSTVSRLDHRSREAVKVTAADLSLAAGVTVDAHRAHALAHRLIDRGVPHSAQDIAGPAVSALSKDLLPGWYDQWAVTAAEDWHQLRLSALEAVATRLTMADRLPEAAAAALAAVRADPLRETARAALIRVYMAEGNQSNAYGEFERYRVVLNAELGMAPTSRLRQLLESDQATRRESRAEGGEVESLRPTG